jgi:hypothetical protein
MEFKERLHSISVFFGGANSCTWWKKKVPILQRIFLGENWAKASIFGGQKQLNHIWTINSNM